MTQMIRIVSKHDGFRRAGVAHHGTQFYPLDRFGAAELAALRAEPMLVVDLVDDTDRSSAGRDVADLTAQVNELGGFLDQVGIAVGVGAGAGVRAIAEAVDQLKAQASAAPDPSLFVPADQHKAAVAELETARADLVKAAADLAEVRADLAEAQKKAKK